MTTEGIDVCGWNELEAFNAGLVACRVAGAKKLKVGVVIFFRDN